MFYLRNTNTPEADLERGFSFAGFQLFDTEAQAIEEFSLYGDEDYVAQDNTTGMWGRRLSGLCAHEEFETLEDALAAIEEHEGKYDGPFVVFEGENTWDLNIDQGDTEGVRFTPLAIAYVVA